MRENFRRRSIPFFTLLASCFHGNLLCFCDTAIIFRFLMACREMLMWISDCIRNIVLCINCLFYRMVEVSIGFTVLDVTDASGRRKIFGHV